MVPGVGRIGPNEMGRQYVTLPGVVIAHEVKDYRWRLTKWLDAKLPPRIARSLGLQDELHYFVQVHLDDEAYKAANGKLKIEYLNGDYRFIGNDKRYEVEQEDFAHRYAIGTRVSVTYGMSPVTDQYFTGTLPVCWELNPLENEEKFLKLPGAIMPGQRDLFFV